MVIGVPLALTSRSILRRVISFRLAGESYRAGAYKEGFSSSHVGVLGIVSDVRLTITAEAGSPAGDDGDDDSKIAKYTRDKKEWAVLENELKELKGKVEDLLPKLESPIVEDKVEG